jgi:hypothetical protein
MADLYKRWDAVNLVSKPEHYSERLAREGVEVEEGKVKDMLMDLEDDATKMSKVDFVAKHGEDKASMWDKVNSSDYQDISDLMDDAPVMKCKDCGCEQDNPQPDCNCSHDSHEGPHFRIAKMEDGHTDVDSMESITTQIMKDAMHLYKMFKDKKGTDSLDTWLTNKIAVAADKLNSVRNYLENPTDDEVSEKYTPTKDEDDYDAKAKALQDIQLDPNTSKDPELRKELINRKKALEKDKAIKDDIQKIGESTMSDKKKLNEGISITTDTLEDSIALMTILKNAGLDPSQMNIQKPQPSMPEPAMEPMGQEPEASMQSSMDEPETETYDNEPGEQYLDPKDYELKRNVIPNSKMGPSAASSGDNPLPESEEIDEELTAAQKKLPAGLQKAIAKKQGSKDEDDDKEEVDEAKPDYLDLDKDGDKKEPMKKAAKDKENKKDESVTDTDRMIAELNRQYELMLVGGVQEALGLTASARVIADETLYDGSRFIVAEVVDKGEGLVAEDGAWEGDTTPYRVAYLVKEGKIVGQIGAGDVPYLSQDGNGTRPVNHNLNKLNLNANNFFEDQVLAVDAIKSMYEDLGEKLFREVTTEFGGCEMYRNE